MIWRVITIVEEPKEYTKKQRPHISDVGNCSLLEQSGFLRPFSALFQGRILVSPASPVVDELIRKV